MHNRSQTAIILENSNSARVGLANTLYDIIHETSTELLGNKLTFGVSQLTQNSTQITLSMLYKF